MASTIKGIKTSDNVVHKIDSAALSCGKACTKDINLMAYIVPLILGRDYNEVPAGAPLTFIFEEYDSQTETSVPVQRTLKAHKKEDEPNTLYFSPVFSDDNFTITSSDLTTASDGSFYISFTSHALVSNYMSSNTHGCYTNANVGQFLLVADCLTINIATTMMDTIQTQSSYIMNGENFFVVTGTNDQTEFLPGNFCS